MKNKTIVFKVSTALLFVFSFTEELKQLRRRTMQKNQAMTFQKKKFKFFRSLKSKNK